MITGGCLCGRVRYTAEGPALFGVLCHCRDCQRASGTGHVPVVGVSKADFSGTGDPKSYASIGGSGRISVQAFCGLRQSAVRGARTGTGHGHDLRGQSRRSERLRARGVDVRPLASPMGHRGPRNCRNFPRHLRRSRDEGHPHSAAERQERPLAQPSAPIHISPRSPQTSAPRCFRGAMRSGVSGRSKAPCGVKGARPSSRLSQPLISSTSSTVILGA